MHPRIIASTSHVRWTAMADVRPFRGLMYNPREASIDKVVTQPYDKISREMQDRYYALDPHNIVRVILGRNLEGDSSENNLSLIHISEPTRLLSISYAVF